MCVYISGQEHNDQGFIQRGGALGFTIFTQPPPPLSLGPRPFQHMHSNRVGPAQARVGMLAWLW